MEREEVELLAQIRAAPHDDELRRIYADTLLERGDARGEYTMLELASARDPRSLRFEDHERARALKERHEAEWERELGCAPELRAGWRRGLPHTLATTPELVARHADVLRRLPIVKLHLYGDPSTLPVLAALPELAFVEELVLNAVLHRRDNGPIPAEALDALCRSPNATGLRRLSFEKHALAGATAQILAGARWLEQLEALSIGQLDGEALASVLRGSLSRLRELVLWENELGERGGRAIAEAELPSLAYLRCYRVALHDGARLVLGSRSASGLHRLELEHDFAEGALVALAREAPAALREITLRDCHLSDADAIALAGAALPALERLDLRASGIGERGIAALAASSGLPALTSIWVSGNALEVEAARALFAHRPALLVR